MFVLVLYVQFFHSGCCDSVNWDDGSIGDVEGGWGPSNHIKGSQVSTCSCWEDHG